MGNRGHISFLYGHELEVTHGSPTSIHISLART